MYEFCIVLTNSHTIVNEKIMGGNGHATFGKIYEAIILHQVSV